MSELEDILNYLETTSLEPHDDYVSEFSYKDQKTLWKYIKELQQENQELRNSLERYQKQLNEENLQCTKYAIEINDLKEKLEEYKEIGKEVRTSMSLPKRCKMKKSMCCNADMIYLGKNNIHVPITQVIGNTYNYCCYKCGNCEWSTAKEKCKYKWYKFDKEKLGKLIDTGINGGDRE